MEQVAWVLVTQRQEKPPANTYNYFLKHNNVTIYIYMYIYIYIYIYIYENCDALVVFEWQTIEVHGWCSLFMVLNFSESEAFAGEALVLGDISFLDFSSVLTSDIYSLLILKTCIFTKNSCGNKYSRLANRSEIISYSCSANQMCRSMTVRTVSLPHIRFFLLVSQSNINIGTYLIKGPRLHLLGEYIFLQ